MIRHDPRVIPLRTGDHNLWRSRVERRHLAQVPDQPAPIGDDGVVPGAAVERGEPRQLLVPRECGAHQHDIAPLGQDDDVIAGEQGLAQGGLRPGCA